MAIIPDGTTSLAREDRCEARRGSSRRLAADGRHRGSTVLAILGAFLIGMLAPASLVAQTSDTRPASPAGIPQPAPVESAPLAPPPGSPAAPTPQAPSSPAPAVEATPAPAPQLAQPPAVAPAPAPAPAVNPDATLAGKPGDTTDVDTLVLTARPTLTIAGQTTWDKGLNTLAEVFEKLRGEAGKLGLQVAGRPLTHFIETDDIGFRYEAMLPVDRAPGAMAPGDVRAGSTPQGNALRFTHKAPYDDIDTTYESITAYLDAKGLTVRDQFVEEYVSDPRKGDDPNFEINIYVQPR